MTKAFKVFIPFLVFLILGISLASCGNSSIYVNDHAGVLQKSEINALDKMISDYDKKTGVQIAVDIEDSIGGENIDDYGLKKFNEIGPGQKGINNGVLLLYVPKDRNVRITVGYGLEWCISDETAGSIIEKMKPLASGGKTFEPLSLAVKNIIELSKKYSWKIKYRSLEEVQTEGKDSLGRIVSFQNPGIDKQEGEYIIKLDDNSSAIVNTTKYMTGLIDEINTQGSNCKIVARVESIDPFRVNLMGFLAN
jgi:Beta-propeller domains of methanol dehydrogenase type